MPPTTPADQVSKALDQQSVDQGPKPVVNTCPLSLTWIEIRLVDMEGNPVPNKKYRIRKPDDSIQTGLLDSAGKARVEGIEHGTCLVCFPEFDEEAWERL